MFGSLQRHGCASAAEWQKARSQMAIEIHVALQDANDVRRRLALSSEKTRRAIPTQLGWQLLAQGRGVGRAPVLQEARRAFGSVTCLG